MTRIQPATAVLAVAVIALSFACSGEDDDRDARDLLPPEEAARAERRQGDLDGTARPPPVDAPAEGAPSPAEIARGTAAEVALVPEQHDWTKGDPERGRELYRLYCMVCHGEDGEGDGIGAAALNPKPRNFTTGAFTFDANADGETGSPIDIARVIQRSPSAFGGSPAMPAWGGTFSVEQVGDLVAYVRSLSGARAEPSSDASS